MSRTRAAYDCKRAVCNLGARKKGRLEGAEGPVQCESDATSAAADPERRHLHRQTLQHSPRFICRYVSRVKY